MFARLSSTVAQAAGRRILLVGDLILDRYIYGDAERISPEAPVPVLRAVDRAEGVGGSANAAACLKALGVDVIVCGVVGNDRAGRRLIELLTELGADCSGVVVSSDRPTTTKTRLVGLAQHRHRQQLLRLDEEASGPLSAGDAEQVRSFALRAVADADAICIEDYEKGVVTADLVQAIVEQRQRPDKPILVDPGRLSDYARYRGVTMLTPNRNELALVVGDDCTELPDIAKGAETLREMLSVGSIVVTLDREGALLVSADRDWEHVPTRPRSVYDNTGAGDAVLAMLATALVGGADPLDAVRLANIAGGLEVEKFGCVPIAAEDVLAELRLEDRRRAGKLRTTDALISELKLRRDRAETVVFTNGCFDLLHAGHVDFLERCREEGSLLVVGINSDASIRALNKGGDRPINDQSARGRLLGALTCVDYVVIFDEPDPLRVITQIKPDVLVKGEDWSEKGVIGREFVESSGGRVKLLPLLEGYSSSSIIERIRGQVSQETP